ncbi:Putative sensor [Frankineae bacterium MT45]|nr:Putative sensor [Frankineae bacterium MT45]
MTLRPSPSAAPTPPDAVTAPAGLALWNPVRLLFSPAPWASLLYVVSYLIYGLFCFVVALVTVVVGAALGLTWLGLPLLLLALLIVRTLAAVERRRVGIVGARIGVARPRAGVRDPLRRQLRDGGTWRDFATLVLLWPYLFVVELFAFVFWSFCVMLLTCPLWYRYVPQTFENGTTGHGLELGWYPDGPHGDRRYGFFIGDLHSALGAAVTGLLLLTLVGSYLIVAAARHHVARVATLSG